MIRTLAGVAALLFAGGWSIVSGQTTWPTTPDSNATLLADTNFLGSNLSSSVTSTQTTFTVTSASLLGANQEVFVDFEAVKITAITGHTLTVARGYDSTVATSHAANAKLYRLPGAALHNNVLSAIFAMQRTPFHVVSSAPSGACTPNNAVEWFPSGSIFGCVAGIWQPIAGGGGGSGSHTTVAFTNQTSIAVPYNLGTNNVVAQVYDATGLTIPGGYTLTLANDDNNATLSFATPQSGSITVFSAGNGAFSEAFTAQTSFNVPHNLGTLTPILAVYNTSNTLVYGQTLHSVDLNNATLSFATPQSGTVILLKQ